jgi:hypothetical protein
MIVTTFINPERIYDLKINESIEIPKERLKILRVSKGWLYTGKLSVYNSIDNVWKIDYVVSLFMPFITMKNGI